MIASAHNNEDGTVTVVAMLKPVSGFKRVYTCTAPTFEEAKEGMLAQIDEMLALIELGKALALALAQHRKE
jgi:hypothetical protein